MLAAKIMEQAQINWASRIVIAPKKDGTARFFVDYGNVNEVTIANAYPIPRMNDCIESLGDYIFVLRSPCQLVLL